METEFFVKTLSLNCLCLVKIDNSPFLVVLTGVFGNSNWVSFFILGVGNIKNLVVGPIDELTLLEFEDLEPSRVSGPDLHVVCLSCTLDIE
jgi:hypothetical protein